MAKLTPYDEYDLVLTPEQKEYLWQQMVLTPFELKMILKRKLAELKNQREKIDRQIEEIETELESLIGSTRPFVR